MDLRSRISIFIPYIRTWSYRTIYIYTVYICIRVGVIGYLLRRTTTLVISNMDLWWKAVVTVGTTAFLLNPRPTAIVIPSLDVDLVRQKYNGYSREYDLIDGDSAATKAFGVLELRQKASEQVQGNVLEGSIPVFVYYMHICATQNCKTRD